MAVDECFNGTQTPCPHNEIVPVSRDDYWAPFCVDCGEFTDEFGDTHANDNDLLVGPTSREDREMRGRQQNT